jgi:competence protein ComEA
LAARVNDGDEIAAARVGETLALPARRTTSRTRTRTRSARTRSAKQPPASPVDVNIADAAALATVPGIGATLASRIVALREQDGRFASFDELLDVAGMTEARLERAQPYLSI